MIPSGTVEEYLPSITHSLQLIRLGSDRMETYKDINVHRSLPRSSFTASSFSPSSDTDESETQLHRPLFGSRNRFTMPARTHPTKPAHLVRVSKFDPLNEGAWQGGVANQHPHMITVTAEVHNEYSRISPSSPSPPPLSVAETTSAVLSERQTQLRTSSTESVDTSEHDG